MSPVSENANVIPRGTSIINLEIYPPPNLVIEVANTSLPDDKGEKLLLYEAITARNSWKISLLISSGGVLQQMS
ncbi:MAG: Uma2 family endonuclease [Trichodesmium sp. MAG_R03]|nr:Uma2 family endonuclease [Trichodesmium sp. MAG_R03]